MNALILTSGDIIAARIVSAWLGAGHSVAALWVGSKNPKKFLRRDRELGILAPSWSFAAVERRHKFPVSTKPKLTNRGEAAAQVARLNANVLITAVTAEIIPDDFLALFPGRAVNFHPAILPHYRGPNPRLGMLIDGTAELHGGITLHCLTRGIDEGDIIGLREVPYEAARGFIDWDVRLAAAAGDLVRNELQNYLRGASIARPQQTLSASYRKVSRAEFELSEAHTGARNRWLCDRLAGSPWLGFLSDSGARYRVSRFIGEVGPRTLTKARIGKHRIEFDAADQRVAVARPRPAARLIRLFKYWRAIARTSRQPSPRA